MDIFLFLVSLAIWVVYALVSTGAPTPSSLGKFELKRRSKKGTKALSELDREERFKDVYFMHQIISTLLFATAVTLTLIFIGWLWGVVVVVVACILINTLATREFMIKSSSFVVGKIEPFLIKLSKKWPKLFKYIRDYRFQDTSRYKRVHSKEELIHVLSNSPDALTETENKIVKSGLSFSEKIVRSVMTDRSNIKYVKSSEFLGPVVLDELHSYGHSRLPVVEGDIDHIIGILYLRDLLSLDQKKSATAESYMDKKVYYIKPDESLDKALKTFIKVRHHLLVVIDDDSNTLGIISLEDVIEELIGQKIVDEDDIIV